MNTPKIKELLSRQTSLTLQQRLAQLVGAKINILIPPFGNIEDAPIVKITRSVISLGGVILSPSGLLVIPISRRANNPTKNKFNIALNSDVPEGIPNRSGAFLNNRKFVQIGKDFIETTVTGRSIELIPLSKVTIIFPSGNCKGNKRSFKFRKTAR